MNWKAFKLFNQLFKDGIASNELLQYSLGKRALEMEYIAFADENTISKGDLFDQFYSDSIQSKFNAYFTLLNKYNLLDTNFSEFELDALVRIEKEKEAILSEYKSQKEIATDYFEDAKYLKKGSRLVACILTILEIEELLITEHDQQYLKILHCKNKIPKAIILCENENKLTKPRLKDIELWYAGGRNTAKLKFIAEPTIPIYYLCDWDNKGIEIFQDIKKNIFPKIEILVPQGTIKYKQIKSQWKVSINYSYFTNDAVDILSKLIPDNWIEEESITHELLKA